MRLIFFLLIATLGLYSCNNDLTTIGQDLINNGNHIEVQTTLLKETGTIKIDSFITSSGRYGSAITEMFMGRYEDQYSGVTTASPCFQIVPVSQPSINFRYLLDSVTFHFKVGKNIWGDTTETATPQTLSLYRLARLPEFRTDQNDYFYNRDSIPWGDKLATVSFIPKRMIMNQVYFKLEKDTLTEGMFAMMQNDDPIFRPNSNSEISYYKFINYFKGLAIQSGKDNNCLLSLEMIPDSLYMRFHYHNADQKYTYDLKLLSQRNEYQYFNVKNIPSEKYGFEALTEQTKEVKFTEHDMAIVQGLSGYMVKMVLPEPDVQSTYKTVVKAEIEIKPRVWASPEVAYPSTISVYYTNKINEIKGVAYNSTNNPITGRYVKTENNEEDRYIFDITDYYQTISRYSDSKDVRQLLLTIPNLTSSFNRMIIKDVPVLRVYYASYKD